jgi:isopentenyl-diphosphate delta-isomerase
MKLDVQYPIKIQNGINQAESHSKRKRDHLRTSLTQGVQFDTVVTGLNDYLFVHQALPEIDAGEIDLLVRLFGKAVRAPCCYTPLHRHSAGTTPHIDIFGG